MEMIKDKDPLFFISISFIVLMAITLPFIFASDSGDGDYYFNGFLLNPLDGNSYLAKMYQGWQGKWRFQLPFTPDPGKGAFLFLFYIFLGHLGRMTPWGLITIFHVARVICALAMLVSIWAFYSTVFDNIRLRRLAFATASLGSGMGCLVLNSGTITADFWVAEAYPFLSAYANPHFPLGLALILGLVTVQLNRKLSQWLIFLSIMGVILLSIVNPFGVIILIMIQSGILLWSRINRMDAHSAIVFLIIYVIAGLPLIIYDYWVANTDPILSIWNEQNLTPSPPFWDLVLSFSPAIIFGLFFIFHFLRNYYQEKEKKFFVLLIWVVLGTFAIYFPLGLQRRFMMGIFIPLSGLAALGVQWLSKGKSRKFYFWAAIFFLLSIPSNLFILLAARSGIDTLNPKIYLTKDEMVTLNWIEENTNPNSLILTSPEMGLYVPAYTGRRVIYGHPFETANATENLEMVLCFYSGDLDPIQQEDFIRQNNVNLVMIGPRERFLGNHIFINEWIEIFQVGEISLYDPYR